MYFANMGVVLQEMAGMRSIVEYKRRVNSATASGARKTFKRCQAHATNMLSSISADLGRATYDVSMDLPLRIAHADAPLPR